MKRKKYNIPELPAYLTKANSFGHRFERLLIEELQNIYADSEVLKCTKTYLDTSEGTDVILGGIRVDITTGLADKSYTYICPKYYTLKSSYGNFKIEFGVRFGNGIDKFEIPVLVIGFNTNYKIFGKKAMNDIINLIGTNFDDIFSIGKEMYDTYKGGKPDEDEYDIHSDSEM